MHGTPLNQWRMRAQARKNRRAQAQANRGKDGDQMLFGNATMKTVQPNASAALFSRYMYIVDAGDQQQTEDVDDLANVVVRIEKIDWTDDDE